MTLETATTFFGWCTVINFMLLLISTIGVVAMRGKIAAIHARMFGLDEPTLSQLYFQYLGRYKIAVIVFCLTPYIALKLMTSG